jgi:hypothetical protein
VRELPRRIAALATVEAVGLIGAAMTLVGVAVTVDALVEASRATPGASLLPWYDRLQLGLWELRLEHTAWFTAGLVVLWWALAHGATLGGRRQQAGRAAGGLAVGFALVAAVMALVSTLVAVRGAIGPVSYPASTRLLVWLLQVATAAGAGAVWTILAVRIPMDEEPLDPPDDDAVPMPAQPEPQPEPEPFAPPPPPPPVREPEPAAVTAPAQIEPAAPAEPATALEQATRIYQERLAYSPNRGRARELLDKVAVAERAGEADEARRLAAELSSL